MPSDESKGSQLDAIGSLAQRQLDNTFWVALRGSWPVWASRLLIVHADTVARWHRDRFRRLCLLFIHPPAPWVGSQPCGAKYPRFCADSKGV